MAYTVAGTLGSIASNTLITSGSTAQVWGAWNQIYYSTVSVTTVEQTWGAWNQEQYTQLVSQQNVAIQPNQEQIEAAMLQAKKAEEDRGRAERRAKEFLLENLSPAQRDSYEKHGLFIVETPKKNRYKLQKSLPPRKLEGENEIVQYCIHTYGVPREDELLGFKLLLEANEEEFLKTANATRLAA